MKKLITFILAFCMVICISGCKNGKDISSGSVDVEYQQIIVDENGNEVTESEPTAESDPTASSNEEDTSNVDTPTSSSEDSSSVTSSNDEENPITIDYNTAVEIDICDDIIRGYLDATTSRQQCTFLTEYSGSKLDYQNVSLDWYFDGSSMYTITISENADFSNAHTLQTKYMNINSTLFVPGKTYYWKVTGTITSDVLGGGKLKIKDAPVRFISIDGTGNVRDMGGWKTTSGKTVKYGMMYRGQKLDNISDAGIETIKKLGLKTELDLRYASQKFQKQGTGMNYVFLETGAQYDIIFNTSESTQAEVKHNYKKIFELLSNKSNYPFYTHCSAGADRTGTFAFIVNGLLGVSYEDLTRDFELTSFSSSGKRWRGTGNGGDFAANDTIMQKDGGNYVAWGELYNEMMAYGKKNGCTTLSQSIEHFLISYVGVPQSQIDSFKSIMLE